MLLFFNDLPKHSKIQRQIPKQHWRLKSYYTLNKNAHLQQWFSSLGSAGDAYVIKLIQKPELLL